MAGKDVVANLFDEAQLVVFKELLPYWAGFRRGFQPPEDPAKRPGMVGKWRHIQGRTLFEIGQGDITIYIHCVILDCGTKTVVQKNFVCECAGMKLI